MLYSPLRPLLVSSSRLVICLPQVNFVHLFRPLAAARKKYRTIDVSQKQKNLTDDDVFVPVPTPHELIVNNFPKPMQPYLRIMRFHSPAGGWLLLFPGYFALSLNSSPGAFCHPSYLVYFGVGTILMRGVGCTINDIVDRKNDLHVTRTKNRPIATGEVTLPKALMFLTVQSSLALYILTRFDLNSIILGLSSVGLVCLYPFAKKFTYWPQLILGFTFNWGALLGWSVMNDGNLYHPGVIPLYLGCVSWTLIYDTIYAHQDRLDDLNIGIKSTAIKFGDQTHNWLKLFSTSMMANFLAVGYLTDQVWPYYAGIIGATYKLYSIISTLNTNDPKNCSQRFIDNVAVGWILLFGIVASALIKKSEKDKMELNIEKAAFQVEKNSKDDDEEERSKKL